MQRVHTFQSFSNFITVSIFSVLSLLSLYSISHAAELSIPDILNPWREWVLHDKREALECIPRFNNPEAFQCAWPTSIDLEINSRGAQFSQQWQIYHEAYIPTPGTVSQWPVNIMVDGLQAAVVPQSDIYGNTIPSVKIVPGYHTVTGSFIWSKQPEYIQIPQESALVKLSMDSVAVEFPNLDDSGRLWLKSAHGEKKEENRLKIESFRLIDDTIPSQVTLYATFDVAGVAREIRVGPLYSPEEFIPLSSDISLPSKLESDGTMQIQVKPGRYDLTLTMRHVGSLSDLTFNPPEDGYWPKQEIWSLLRRPTLRVVEISGGTPIDPKSTSLPEEWRSYPAHLMVPEDSIRFKEIKRGDPDPPPDQLNLHRTLWLAFDGTGYTVQDRITGRKNSGWRLEMEPQMEPGRVMVDGVEQLITRIGSKELADSGSPRTNGSEPGLPESARAGVELRHGILNLIGESRISGALYTVPATGWNHPFQKVTGQLNLPPGWKLIAASGIDNIAGTWVKKWSLLDFFILLIFTIATAKLFSIPLASVSFITMVLLYHEPGAPRYVWLFLITGFALIKQLPPSSSGRFRKVVQIYQFITVMALLLNAVPYAIHSLRVGIYPQLEIPWISMNDVIQSQAGNLSYGGAPSIQEEQRAMSQTQMDSNEPSRVAEESGELNPESEMDAVRGQMPAPAQAPMESYNMADRYKGIAKGKLMEMASKGSSPLAYLKSEKELSRYQSKVMQYDPRALTQTGPGVPLWRPFQTISFSWSGPVEPAQMVSFTLIGPNINLVLAFLRVALTILLALGMFIGAGYGGGKFNMCGGLFKQKRDKLESAHSSKRVSSLMRASALLLASLFLLTVLPISSSHAGEIPSPQMLEELQRRLLERDDCFPACADISAIEVKIEPEELELTLHVDAATATAIPLPGHTRHWLPGEVSINGVTAQALFRSGSNLWVMVPAGKNTLVVKGRIGNVNTLQIPLPLKPHSGAVKARGWEVQGVEPDGSLDDQLQFKRVAGESAQPEKSLETGLLPPFALVERTLLLGLDWKVETTVTRISPQGSALVLNLPLLTGESVITEGVRVKKSVAKISLNANQSSFIFESFLEPSDIVRLHHALSSEQIGKTSDRHISGVSDNHIQKSLSNQEPESRSGNSSENREWTEIWRLDASPLFHVETEGISAIMHKSSDRWYPTWHPWPGEEVVLKVSRPEGVGGQTLTIEKSTLELNPGNRSSRAILTLLIKSSQGGQHTIKIPKGAELQEVAINGAVELIRQEGQKVILPITPGSQSINLVWRDDRGIVPLYRTPTVDLGAPSVNAAVDLHISYDRWPLFVGGQQLAGPAVLFWSVIIVIFIVSSGLAMTGMTPLKLYEWFMLGIGISMSNPVASLFVASWLVVLDMRKKWGAGCGDLPDPGEDDNLDIVQEDPGEDDNLDIVQEEIGTAEELQREERKSKKIGSIIGLTPARFNLMQIGIAALTAVAIFSLLFAISQGLLGHPSMNITGNGSNATFLRWYHDISDATLPVAWLFSLPMAAYRIAMLIWALWLSFWLLKIVKWGWSNFTTPMIWATSAPREKGAGRKRRGWSGIRNLFKSGEQDEKRDGAVSQQGRDSAE